MITFLILGTNGYLPLAVRLVKKIRHHYKGSMPIDIVVATNHQLNKYVPDDMARHYQCSHSDWVEATNSKYEIAKTIFAGEYLYYLDADTNIKKDFTEHDILGYIVGGQHFGDLDWMKDDKAFDRNPASTAYVPFDTDKPQMYYLGAFWGGKTNLVRNVIDVLLRWQGENRSKGIEPVWNDESYLNKYFHEYPPTRTILFKDFPFIVSDKGGMENLRNPKKKVNLTVLEMTKFRLIEIVDGEIIYA